MRLGKEELQNWNSIKKNIPDDHSQPEYSLLTNQKN